MKVCEVCGTSEGRICTSEKLGKTLCMKCYHSGLYKVRPKKESEKQCEICGSTKDTYGKSGKFGMDLCRTHRNKMINQGKTKPPKPLKEIKKCAYCELTGKRVSFVGKYQINLCDKHRAQINKYGKIPERTRFDPNEIVILSDHAEVVLYDKDQNECARTFIDIADIDKVKTLHWGYDKVGNYAKTTINKDHVGMHRFLTDCPKGLDPDHIDNNGLNNRRNNLRITTRSQNAMNSKIKSNNTSGVTGVSWDKIQNQWHVKICVNYKQRTIGYYIDLEEAIAARMDAVKKYHGDFAYKGATI